MAHREGQAPVSSPAVVVLIANFVPSFRFVRRRRRRRKCVAVPRRRARDVVDDDGLDVGEDEDENGDGRAVRRSSRPVRDRRHAVRRWPVPGAVAVPPRHGDGVVRPAAGGVGLLHVLRPGFYLPARGGVEGNDGPTAVVPPPAAG